MKLYHRTPNPQAILDGGFRDAKGMYLTSKMHKGVWFSDMPLDTGEGAKGFTVLSVEIPEDKILRYEWAEEGKPYREFLIPAAVANSYGCPAIDDDDWKGCSEKEILNWCKMAQQSNQKNEAEKVRLHILFLKRHQLLGDE